MKILSLSVVLLALAMTAGAAEVPAAAVGGSPAFSAPVDQARVCSNGSGSPAVQANGSWFYYCNHDPYTMMFCQGTYDYCYEECKRTCGINDCHFGY